MPNLLQKIDHLSSLRLFLRVVYPSDNNTMTKTMKNALVETLFKMENKLVVLTANSVKSG